MLGSLATKPPKAKAYNAKCYILPLTLPAAAGVLQAAGSHRAKDSAGLVRHRTFCEWLLSSNRSKDQ